MNVAGQEDNILSTAQAHEQEQVVLVSSPRFQVVLVGTLV
jgi:hypothetical protein